MAVNPLVEFGLVSPPVDRLPHPRVSNSVPPSTNNLDRFVIMGSDAVLGGAAIADESPESGNVLVGGIGPKPATLLDMSDLPHVAEMPTTFRNYAHSFHRVYTPRASDALTQTLLSMMRGYMRGQVGPSARAEVTTSVQEPSLLPALERIREMAALDADWDSEEADSPTPEAVASACYLIEAVAAGHEQREGIRVTPSTSSPIPDGGLQVEWQGADSRIEVQANPDGSFGYLVKWGLRPDGRYEEADEAPEDVVLGLIARVLAS